MKKRVVSLAAFRAGISEDAQRLVEQVKVAEHESQMRNVHWEIERLGEVLSHRDREAIFDAMKARRWEIYQSKHGPA